MGRSGQERAGTIKHRHLTFSACAATLWSGRDGEQVRADVHTESQTVGASLVRTGRRISPRSRAGEDPVARAGYARYRVTLTQALRLRLREWPCTILGSVHGQRGWYREQISARPFSQGGFFCVRETQDHRIRREGRSHGEVRGRCTDARRPYEARQRARCGRSLIAYKVRRHAL